MPGYWLRGAVYHGCNGACFAGYVSGIYVMAVVIPFNDNLISLNSSFLGRSCIANESSA